MKKKKKIIFITLFSIVMILTIAFITLHFWIECTVKENISIAKQHYGGSDEEALISYLKDEKNTAGNRSHIAIWTLGQIHSKEALPILYSYYQDDPEGNSCYGKHHSKLCQYELYKAIKTIEAAHPNSYANKK